jgi:hypothetical protein
MTPAPVRLIPADAPTVLIVVGHEPGDRGRLVEVLAKVLINLRREAGEREAAGDQGNGGPQS